MKKRILSLFLALALCIGLAVPASASVYGMSGPDKIPDAAADLKFDWQQVSIECRSYYDGWQTVRFTFDKAAVGYQFTHNDIFNVLEEDDGEVTYMYASEDAYISPVIILKDNSRMTIEILDGEYDGLSAGQVDGVYTEYALWGYSYDMENPVLNCYTADSWARSTDPVASGSIEQMFSPKDGKTVAINLGSGDDRTWLIKESDAGLFKVGAQSVYTEFQSTAELTGAAMADMDYNSFTVTVTNNTDATDVGIVALVLASDIITVSPMSYEVPAHSSVDYEVNTVGHMGHLDSRLTLVSGIENCVNASVVHFESIEDYYAFCESFPVEMGENNDLVMQNADMDSVMVCSGGPGTLWLLGLGMSRKATPAAYPGDDHMLCRPLSLS